MTDMKGSQPAAQEMDLHDLIKLLARRVKLIILVTVIGGLAGAALYFLVKPTQSATAVITVDPDTLVSATSPYYLVQNDEIAQAVADKLGMTMEDLPEMTFTVDKNDKSVITIEANANKEKSAMDAANAWAEEAVLWLQQNSNSLGDNLATAQADTQNADKALAEYLQSIGLGKLTWMDLVAITGVGDNGSIMVYPDQTSLPTLTVKQKDTLSQLMRQKTISEWNYMQISKAALTSAQNSAQRIMILNKAMKTEEKHILGGIMAIPVGMVLGVFIACAWILLADWWKNSARMS